MNYFSYIVNKIDVFVWSFPLVILCFGVGLFLSVKTKFVQFRLFGVMFSILLKKEKTDNGITAFQAFAATVGARVGMGNVAGVATAIFIGGPGAVFWMWIIAFLGAASAFTEAVLAQAYKEKDENGQFVGGPSYYIEKGLKCKLYAYIFSAAAVLGPGILMPGVQINSLVSVFEEAFFVNKYITGVISCLFLAIVICGGIKRIAKFSERLTPLMCIVYLCFTMVILIINFKQIPDVFMLIIKSAFGKEPLFAGITGAAISLGVRRGVYSNEAGMGCGAIISGAAETSHPVEQGLIQAFSVYVDTMIICSATAFTILITGTYNVIYKNNLIVDNVGSLDAGIRWTQCALISVYGSWCGKVFAFIIVLFVFTSMLGYFYQAETNIKYLTKNKKIFLHLFRATFIGTSFLGVVVNTKVAWDIGDIGYGIMAWLNITAIFLLYPKTIEILNDYEKQHKQGENPVFKPKEFGIEDKYGIWDKK